MQYRPVSMDIGAAIMATSLFMIVPKKEADDCPSLNFSQSSFCYVQWQDSLQFSLKQKSCVYQNISALRPILAVGIVITNFGRFENSVV